MGEKAVPGKVSRLALPLSLSALLLTGQGALGHAYVDRSEPPAGARLEEVPPAVCIWYTEPVEKAFSRVVVTDAAGNRVDDEEQLKKSRRRFGASEQLTVPLRPIGPGTYTVDWQVLSIDTHVTEGRFTFTVLEGARPGTDRCEASGGQA